MLIRKTQQPSDYPENQIQDAYSTSTTDTYSCNYINELFTMGVDSYQLATNGYIRLVNGLQIAWAEKSFSFTMTSWGNIYYCDLSGMPDWVVPFTRVYQKHTTSNNKQAHA